VGIIQAGDYLYNDPLPNRTAPGAYVQAAEGLWTFRRKNHRVSRDGCPRAGGSIA